MLPPVFSPDLFHRYAVLSAEVINLFRKLIQLLVRKSSACLNDFIQPLFGNCQLRERAGSRPYVSFSMRNGNRLRDADEFTFQEVIFRPGIRCHRVHFVLLLKALRKRFRHGVIAMHDKYLLRFCPEGADPFQKAVLVRMARKAVHDKDLCTHLKNPVSRYCTLNGA